MKVFYLLLICLVFLLTACSPIVKVQDENAQRLGTAEQADAAYTPVTIENINEKGDPIAQVDRSTERHTRRSPTRVSNISTWRRSS